MFVVLEFVSTEYTPSVIWGEVYLARDDAEAAAEEQARERHHRCAVAALSVEKVMVAA